jgi:hypothetical protein
MVRIRLTFMLAAVLVLSAGLGVSCAGDDGDASLSAASLRAATITPNLPGTTDDLVCSIKTPSSDPDGDDITYSYQWYKDGVLQDALTTDTVDSSRTAEGQVWRCVVIAGDGTGSEAVASDEVTILKGESATPDGAGSDGDELADTDSEATPDGAGSDGDELADTDSEATPDDAGSDEIVTGQDLGIVTSSLPDGALDSAYSHAIEAQGGTAPYTWSVTSGSLPDGLSLNTETGLVHGSPATADTFALTIKVADSASRIATKELSITIQPNNDDNHKPIASAGDSQEVDVGDVVQLDGSGSSDDDGDPLTYQWSFTSRPTESSAAFSDDTLVNPTFEMDVAGTYVVQLIVNDGEVDSDPDGVTVTAEDLPPVQGITIDHLCTDLSAIPDAALLDAAAIRIMVRHACTGIFVSQSLDEFYDLDSKYDRSNWDFQLRWPLNPGWQAKVDGLVTQTAAQLGDFDVFTMKWCVDDVDDGASWEYYRDHMEQLEADYPDKIFVWWTLRTATWASSSRDAFNASVRSYCEANNKILFDIADIECHDPSGVKQTDDYGHEILYGGYTYDRLHLNATGCQRVASAFWHLMARLAGWDGT